MKAASGRKSRLIVTQEAIADFSRVSYANRLRWLDEMRSFLGKVRGSSAAYVRKARYKK